MGGSDLDIGYTKAGFLPKGRQLGFDTSPDPIFTRLSLALLICRRLLLDS